MIMKKNFYSTLITVVLFCIECSSFAFPQSQYARVENPSMENFQFSAQDNGALSIISNPATLGIGHASDLWYTTTIERHHFLEHNFFVQTPFLFTNFGANYRKVYSEDKKQSADVYGFGFGMSSHLFSFGFATDFLVSKTEEATLSHFGILYSPTRMFSLAYVAKNFNAPSTLTYIFHKEQIFGVAIRPMFSKRITLFLDVKSDKSTLFGKTAIQFGAELRINQATRILFAYHDAQITIQKLYSFTLTFDFSQSNIFSSVSTSEHRFPETSLGMHFSDDENDVQKY